MTAAQTKPARFISASDPPALEVPGLPRACGLSLCFPTPGSFATMNAHGDLLEQFKAVNVKTRSTTANFAFLYMVHTPIQSCEVL